MAVKIRAGYALACALLSNGSVKCWGPNRHGQLGNGTLADSLVPVAVDGSLFDPRVENSVRVVDR